MICKQSQRKKNLFELKTNNKIFKQLKKNFSEKIIRHSKNNKIMQKI